MSNPRFKHDTYKLADFWVVGISIRTANANGQAHQDLGKLWQRFMAEQVSEAIPQKLDPRVYCLYTEYESDSNAPYTAVLGHRVESPTAIPEGMKAFKIAGGTIAKIETKGPLPESVVEA